MLLISERQNNNRTEDKLTTSQQESKAVKGRNSAGTNSYNYNIDLKSDVTKAAASSKSLASATSASNNVIVSGSCEQQSRGYSMGKNTEGGGVSTVGEEPEEQQHEGPDLKALNAGSNADVEELTTGLKACSLSKSGSGVGALPDLKSTNSDNINGVDADIVKGLKGLNLSNGEPKTTRLRPQESDERGNDYEDDEDKQSCDDNNDQAIPEHTEIIQSNSIEKEEIVRLQEPSYEENEEGKSPKVSKESEDEDDLLDRGGPEGGTPATHSYNNISTGYNGFMYPEMPASFPNYRNISTSFTESSNCAKRTIDQQEQVFNTEPYKYTRPHPQQQQQELLFNSQPYKYTLQQQHQAMNNLDNPGSSLKQVVSSSTLQMSGGTVYTNDNTPAPSDCNDLPINFTNIDALSQTNQLEHQASMELFGMNCPNLPNLSPEDIAKVTGEATEADDPTGFPGQGAGPTQLPRVETLLRGSSTKPEDMILRNIMPQQLQQPQQLMVNRNSSGSSGDDTGYISEPSPLDKNLFPEDIDCSLLSKYLEGGDQLPVLDNQHYQPQQTSGNRSSYGSNEDDHGYTSETSPPHEMERSPAGSNHGLALSPPRSNLSMATIDSGVGSPMSEDGSTLGKSPRHITNCSPLQVSPFSPAGPQGGQGLTETYVQPQVFTQPQQMQQPALNTHYQSQDDSQLHAQRQQQQQQLQPNSTAFFGSDVSFPADVANILPPSPQNLGRMPQQQGFTTQNGPGDVMPCVNNFSQGQLTLDSTPIFRPHAPRGPVSPGHGFNVPLVDPSLPAGSCSSTVPGVTSLQDLLPDKDDYHSHCLDQEVMKRQLKDVLEVVGHDLGKSREELRRGRGTSLSGLAPLAVVGQQAQSTENTYSQRPAPQEVCSNRGMALPVNRAPIQVPNLPTTVPTTIGANMRPSLQGKPKDMAAMRQPGAGHPPAYEQTNSSTPKVPIPPLRKPGQQQQQRHPPQLPQVLVLPSANQGSNVLFISPMLPSAASKPRFPTILPKPAPGTVAPKVGATAPVGVACSTAGPGQASKAGNAPGTLKAVVANLPVALAPNNFINQATAQVNRNQGGLVESIPSAKLNKSRRFLADWSTEKILKADDDGDNWLHKATVKSTNPDMVALVVAILERLGREDLLDTVNAQNNSGQTALYIAACTNQASLVKLFIEKGADVNLFAENNLASGVIRLSAIHCVACKGEQYLPTLNALLTSSLIDVDLVNSNGHSALHCAIMNHDKIMCDNLKVNSIPIAQALLCAGANPNLQLQQDGKTALMMALEYRCIDLLEAMIQVIEPSRLAAYLKTEAFDGSTCHKIAKSLKSSLNQQDQERLTVCLRLAGTNCNQQQQQQHH